MSVSFKHGKKSGDVASGIDIARIAIAGTLLNELYQIVQIQSFITVTNEQDAWALQWQ
jgi:hypothetical protein